MDIDARRLRYLLAVARAGGVLAAADDLGKTPSAVSQQITRLEQETRRVLMTRTTHGSALTPEGHLLAEAAQEIERTLAAVQVRLERGDAEVHGTMRLGGFQSFLSVVVAPALAEWQRLMPAVDFEIVESEPETLTRSLKSGELDVVVMELDAGDPPTRLSKGMLETPLLDEPWKLVVPAGTLAADITDLARSSLPWLGVDHSSASARAVARLSRANGMDQSTVHRYATTQTALSLVAAGQGMALIPLLALHGLPQDGVETLDVPGLGTRRIVVRSYSRGQQTNALVTAVTGLIQDAMQHLVFE